MPQFSIDDCSTIKGQTICASNITLIFYDGHLRNASDCTVETCSLLISNWGYLPNVPANIFFIIFFAAILLVNIPLGLWKRTWGVLVGMSVGAFFELLGYVGRTMAHYQPFKFNPFLIYIIFLTIGPALISAAIYLCLARIIVVYGEGNARFKPRTYSIVFMVSDFVALLLQGAGGGIAASADDHKTSQNGINIMIAGLVWQVVSLTLFAAASFDLAWCVKKGRSVANPSMLDLRASKKFKGFLWALGIATLSIYVRSVYRVAELSEGFDGSIANQEIPFMIFEPTMIAIACLCMTIWHPSYVFGDAWKAADFRLGKTEKNMEFGLGNINKDSSSTSTR